MQSFTILLHRYRDEREYLFTIYNLVSKLKLYTEEKSKRRKYESTKVQKYEYPGTVYSKGLIARKFFGQGLKCASFSKSKKYIIYDRRLMYILRISPCLYRWCLTGYNYSVYKDQKTTLQ